MGGTCGGARRGEGHYKVELTLAHRRLTGGTKEKKCHIDLEREITNYMVQLS